MTNFSIQIGHFLFRHMFPVYNMVYPILKRRQDKREIAVISQYVKPGFVVLDIGANIGFYTRILSELAGNEGKIYSFEPDGINFSRLRANCSALSNVHLVNSAVSDSDGVLKIYKSPMLNVDHRTYPVDDFESVEEIPCMALDSFFPAKQRVDFIKIDIQGFEVSAFEGMKRVLDENPQVVILSEFWPYGLKKAGRTTKEFLDYFFDRNLSVHLVTGEGFEPLSRDNYFGYDVIKESVYMNIFVTPKA
jgi:FkbM family methyltransferase